MYIQITERCNMSCRHCGFRCGVNGNDMSLKTLERILYIIKPHENHLTIGGGEPTIHPLFKEILGRCIIENSSDEMKVLIITNGSHKEYSLMLAKLNRNEIIVAELSKDIYHDPIDIEVENAFFGHTRCVENNEIVSGRWADLNGIEPNECICEDTFFSPQGNVKKCGCLDAPILFNVFDENAEELLEKLMSEENGCFREIDEDDRDE